MKPTLLVKLAPTSEHHASLLRTLEAFIAACNAVAVTAFCERRANKLPLRRLVYYYIRQQSALSAQMAIRAISKVSEAYMRDKNVQPAFRSHRTKVYNERICSFARIDYVSLLACDRRFEVPFRFGADTARMLQGARGQADLLDRHDIVFLADTVDATDPTRDETDALLGVDLGINQLATTSHGEFLIHSTGPNHAHVEDVRARSSRFCAKLDEIGPKLANRLLRQFSGCARRFSKGVNHCLSKALVGTPKGTERGITWEDLTRIGRPAKGSKRLRSVLHLWTFFQPRAFIADKAALSGVRVLSVNPAYTRRACSVCGHCEQANRRSQLTFHCRSCGFSANAAIIPPDAVLHAS